LEKTIEREVKNPKSRVVKVEVIQIESPELNARIIGNEIAIALENRAPFRTAQKFAIRKVMKAGAKGIKTRVSGRLGGVDMARSEGYTEGVVPLQTFRQDIDYASVEADTSYCKLGVKV
jgi:small subunit ribosomal protein S3